MPRVADAYWVPHCSVHFCPSWLTASHWPARTAPVDISTAIAAVAIVNLRIEPFSIICMSVFRFRSARHDDGVVKGLDHAVGGVFVGHPHHEIAGGGLLRTIGALQLPLC